MTARPNHKVWLFFYSSTGLTRQFFPKGIDLRDVSREKIASVMDTKTYGQNKKPLCFGRLMVYLYKVNQTDSSVLYLEVETARVPGDRIHATVASSRRDDAGQRKKRYAMGDKGKKDKDKSQKQKKKKEEQKKKKQQEKQPSEIPWQRGK